ncbi:MAG: hypothetical protein ACI9W6_001227 [Motiliproteus sp.]|jgi:hypothetical protein
MYPLVVAEVNSALLFFLIKLRFRLSADSRLCSDKESEARPLLAIACRDAGMPLLSGTDNGLWLDPAGFCRLNFIG